ncbi:MAG TPA: nuclear transport factor 2 family protein [Polyangia bacterium]|nr:nuclear transport factor 2 family protein [Polyangia bacterium]
MSSPTEVAARTYVAAWQEPDPAARARLIDACFAPDARIVAPGAVIGGRAGLEKAIRDLLADPRGLSARLTSAIDVQGCLFRFRSVVADRDGRVVFDGFDAAEVDAEGRITVLLAFGGAPPAPASGP